MKITSLILKAVYTLLLITPLVVYADFNHFEFSEPGSGQKVKSYTYELTFAQGQVRQYQVPNDCQQILNEVTFGMPSPNLVLQRSIWFKMINDCRYVAFLHQNESHGSKQDFVSQYDFYNARLADLPFQSSCKEESTIESCKSRPAEPGMLKLSSFFPFLNIVMHDGVAEVSECRFYEGAFRGELMLTDEGIRCHSNPRSRGLRLLSVDYADFNNDGFEDALLRMMPLGRSVSRMPILLPLTRFADDQRFTLPQGLSMNLLERQ